MSKYFPWWMRFSPVWVAIAILVVAGIGAATAQADSASAGDAALFDRLDTDGDGLISAAEIGPAEKRLFDRLLRRADADGDGALARREFLSALRPSRPEKPIEAKLPSTFPQADAVRYVLLTIDTDFNGVIEADEVPGELRRVFDDLVVRLDRNGSGALEPFELARGGRPLAQLAGQYVASRGIDAAVELDELEKAQGAAAERFDARRSPAEMLANPQQASALFARIDANGDGYVQAEEVPDPFQPQVERFLRFADRDGDGRLSKREFLAGAERVSRLMSRRP